MLQSYVTIARVNVEAKILERLLPTRFEQLALRRLSSNKNNLDEVLFRFTQAEKGKSAPSTSKTKTQKTKYRGDGLGTLEDY